MRRASFAAEVYLPSGDPERFPAISDRAHAVVAEMAREGHEISYRGAMLLPEDETCFYLFDAESEDGIHEAGRRAEVAFDRIVPAAMIGSFFAHPRGEQTPDTEPSTT